MEVGGVNLAALSQISTSGTASVLLEEFTFTITCDAAAYDACGLMISSAIFVVGGRYILSFALRKTSGILSGVGGHMAGFEQEALYIDGQRRMDRWSSGTALPDDENEHRIELHLTYRGGAADNNLYVQPNCGFAETSGPYSVQISRIQVERGSIATDWYPASEDIQEHVELQLTNVRTQITAATNSIRQEVEADYARADDLENTVARLNSLSEQTEDSFTWTVQQLSILQEDVSTGNSSIEKQLSEIMSYMTFDSTGLTIGKTGNPVTVHIGNDRVSFRVGGGTVAYFSNNTLYVENGEF